MSRQQNVHAAQWSANGGALGAIDLEKEGLGHYGELTFSEAVQQQRLPEDAFSRLQQTLESGDSLSPDLADAVAEAMREWAMEHGATHYCHWFQPLTGLTAEKHDSFFEPVGDGTAIAEFSGEQLIQGEPDASSFPSGGIRATFEARGYTAWDPTSPAFILENPNGTLLCIPTAFVSWTGEALDAKIPLLRSMDALSTSGLKALSILGENTDAKRIFTTVGAEQEYFLIDEQYYFSRPDLYTTGRTLFGAKPPKGHELDEHYFGTIPERVLAYMMEVEQELRRLGVPVTTRHNEVAPGQYELAPIFENSNLGSDHQQLTMIVLQNVARRYGLVCLLHEKPFAGVNGSGKHNNWSMGTDTGQNLLKPGKTPVENSQFLFFCSAVIRAVNKHQKLLRASVANIGQDHRLGANEAPPAIISIFLGAELENAFEQIAEGHGTSVASGDLDLGAAVLPSLQLDGGDRNRTSPFAFTGAKFEFRALGSSMSLGFTNTVLNTIVAEAIDELADELQQQVDGGASVTDGVRAIVKATWDQNKQVIFGGDGYSAEWEQEAERRGLANLKTTPDALPAIVADTTIAAFEHYKVLSHRELEARFEVFVEQYATKMNIEGETAFSIAKTMILPAALRHLALLNETATGPALEGLVNETKGLIERLVTALGALDDANQDPGLEGLELATYMRDSVFSAMSDMRLIADKLETVVSDDLWPLPKYSEVLFIK
jgi:glutamine synthetase